MRVGEDDRIVGLQDQADYAPVLQYLELYSGPAEFESELIDHLRGPPWGDAVAHTARASGG